MTDAIDSLQLALQAALGADYQIERALHGSGISRVFVAREPALNRRVVIKTLSPDFAGINAERFRREIMLTASLQQANIVPVLAAGEIAGEGLPYYIMPFVEGESLHAHLAARGRLPVREAAGILRDVARALAFAHSRGVVHRDIKPDNVLLSGSTAVVTDFGIAKAIEAVAGGADAGALTQIGTAIGTPMYRSPEQASGETTIDARADIYALGVLAYELLTGAPPFVGPTARALLAAHVTEAPADVAVLRNDLPPALAALIMQSLEKDPARRPPTAQRVLDALDSLPANGLGPRDQGAKASEGDGDARPGRDPSATVAAVREPLALPLREAPRGAIWSSDIARQSGLELLRSFLAGDLPSPPITSLTGLRLTEVGFGSAAAAMPSSGWWQSGAGVFLAGTIAFVADLPLSAAALTSAPAGTVVTSSHLSVNYFRPATIESKGLVGRGRLIHSTRSLALAEALVQDGRGRLLGHATSRCVLVRGDGRRPPPPRTPAPSILPDPYLRPVEGDVLGQAVWDETPGLEIVRRIAADALRPPVSLMFDWRGLEAREGECIMRMPASAWLCNAFGTLYGGALAAFADLAMTLAVGSTVPPACAYSPLDMTVHFLRPVLPDASGGEIVARAHVTHRGRTMAVTSCDITDSGGRLVAKASGSALILPGRPWQRPVNVGDEIEQGGAP